MTVRTRRGAFVDGRYSIADGRYSIVDGRYSIVDGRYSTNCSGNGFVGTRRGAFP